MPSTRSSRNQGDLCQAFPVRKRAIRSTKKAKDNMTSENVSPRKRQSPPSECFEDCSPTKKLRHFPAGLKSPVKMLMLPQRIPLSPRKDVLINSPRLHDMRSPHRALQASAVASPSKRKALNFSSPCKENGLNENSPVRSPRKSVIPKAPTVHLMRQSTDCYQSAKKALHTALPDRLLCRETEMNTLNDFLDTHLENVTPGSLYISGAPGTGKTAVMSLTRQRLQEERACQSVYVNCMSVQNPQAIFNKIYSEFNQGKELSLSVKAAIQKLEKVLTSKGPMVVLILDEIDQLDCRNQEILYTMFEWPTLPNSRLVLIGIANALDLTDRILPRLQAHPKCRPQLLNFTPYTKDQLIRVLKDRLLSLELNGHSVIEPSAVQFCAMKVAAVAGDMRKALDVCRRAVEAVETEVRKQQVLFPGSPSKRPAIPKKIGVAHILRIVNAVYGSRVSSHEETIPLQQQLAMCTLLMVVRQGRGKETTLGKFHEYYSNVCKGQKLQPVDQSEFFSLCSHMETRGIIRIKKSKEARNAKVNLGLDEKELEVALQDKTLLSAVLDKGLKGK